MQFYQMKRRGNYTINTGKMASLLLSKAMNPDLEDLVSVVEEVVDIMECHHRKQNNFSVCFLEGLIPSEAVEARATVHLEGGQVYQ